MIGRVRRGWNVETREVEGEEEVGKKNGDEAE